MRLNETLEAARADMQKEIDRRIGRGVRVLIVDDDGNFTGYAFLTKQIEVKAAVVRGNDIVFVASAMPIADMPTPVILDFSDLEDIQVGFKLVGVDGASWEARTEDYLTTYNKQLLGI